MKRTRKQIGSLLLSVCMVFTMLPTAAFAEEGVQNSGTPSSTSEITAVADLAKDVALQEVETSTTLEELNLPSTLTVTVTTGSAITATVSGDDIETDSEAQETKTQEETTIDVPEWIADPAYDGDTAGDYTFTPTLDLPEDTTLADGVPLPKITVTVKAADTPMLLGAGIQPLDTGTNITDKFTDAIFLGNVRTKLGKEADEPIYDNDDFASVTILSISNKNIASLAGIEYFTALTNLTCNGNQLTALDVSKNTKLINLDCAGNQLSELDVSKNTALTTLDCGSNQLKALNVSKNDKLTTLSCIHNQLNALDVSKNTALTNLDFTANKLIKLDVSKNIALTRLSCTANQLNELDVSKNIALTSLSCSYNQLSALDVRQNTALTSLFCTSNKLIKLDVSKNTVLITLKCSLNYMADVSAVKDLDTNLTTNFTFDPQNSGTLPGNEITDKFTDINFLGEVRKVLGKKADEPIYDNDDFASVTTLSINNKNIESLAGIEYFTALTMLTCNGNQLTELDVSKNTALSKLFCNHNQLSELDVSKNTTLTTLDCGSNQLNALNVSKNTKLTTLICNHNQLNSLDVSSNIALTILSCTANQLSALDVSKNNVLKSLYCSLNYMTGVSAVKGLDTDVTTNFTFNPQNATYSITVNSGTANRSTAAENATVTITADTPNSGQQFKEWTVVSGGVTLASTTLATTTFTMPANAVEVTATYESITASGTDITAKFTDANFLAAVRTALNKVGSIPISDTDNFASVTSLNMSDKDIKSLAGIEYFTALTTLNCNGNQLTALDVSKNTKLTELFCGGNQLSTLNVSKSTELTYLSCNNNRLTALDVSKNTALIELYCYNNQLSTLDVSNNTAFTKLDCNNNQLSSLDVSNNTVLTELWCNGNQLTALDVSKNAGLIALWCNSNQLTALDVSNNTALTMLNCSSNYMANESAVNGLDTSRTTTFIFDPQKSGASTYAVTINNGTASLSTAAEGATVTITANTPDSGKRFKEWTIDSGGVTLYNAQASNTTFTMPANSVKITATYEDIPAGVTPVTGVTLNKNNLSLYSNTTPNTVALTATVAPASATDKSVTWQSSNTSVATVDTSGNVKAAGNGTATITVTTTDGRHTASCTVIVSTYTKSNRESPVAFMLSYQADGEMDYTVTIPKLDGCEYSFDGSSWSDRNSKTGIQVGESITGYYRYKETNDYNASSAVSDTITLPKFKVKAPVISPKARDFIDSVSVLLTTATDGAKIFYTTDGTTPTAINGAKYTKAITFSVTTTIKAVAVKEGFTDSDVVSVVFTKKTNTNNSSSDNGTTTDETSTNQNIVATTQGRSSQRTANSSQNEANKPYLPGEEGKSGWKSIITEIEERSDEADTEPVTLTVEMNGATIIPANVISKLRGKNKNLVLDMGNGITWTINGMDVEDTQLFDIDLGVTRNTSVIPEDAIGGIRGDNNSIQIELAHNGAFGFGAKLTIAFDEAEVGKYANLFYYNQESGELEYMESVQVGEDGKAALNFAHASAYSIVLSSEPMDESTITASTSDNNNQTNDSSKTVTTKGETSGSMMVIWLILGMIVVVVIVGTTIYMRSKKDGKEEN